MQSFLNKRHNYVIYFDAAEGDEAYSKQYRDMHKSDPRGDQHAGESETSFLLYYRPDLMRMDRATQQSGADQKRLPIPGWYTPIWLYPHFLTITQVRATKRPLNLVN